jgi:diacylglycerol kinase (ATP)
MHVHVILNPAAGRLKPALAALFEPHDAACEIVSTTQRGDAQAIARAAAESGVDVVAVCGGDGTVMEAARGLVGTDVSLAILPSGTANLLARDLGIPHRWQDAAALIFSPRAVVRPIDMIRADELLFFHLGIGLEGAMVRRAGTAAKRRTGLLTYYLSALTALPFYRPAHYRLTLDGVPIEIDGVNCTITTYGHIGPLPLAHAIDPGDGWLDVIVIRRADLKRLLLAGRSALSSGDLSGAIWHRQARAISLIAEPPQPVTGDGESITLRDPSMHIVPRAVRVFTP